MRFSTRGSVNQPGSGRGWSRDHPLFSLLYMFNNVMKAKLSTEAEGVN